MMMLRSGALIDPLNIDFTRVRLSDVAWALDGEQRWAAQCDPRISVAQHAIACAREAYIQEGPLVALLALHHDDSEAFFKDMPRDLKSHPRMRWYREQEAQCTRLCVLHFAPECAHMPLSCIKRYDTASLLTEFRDRFPRKRDRWAAPAGEPLHQYRFAERDDWRVWLRMHHTLHEEIHGCPES